ncbi:hypothetical protein FB451DRAFT_155668 [Mycena latifolia]|nr:hypothetical protein FB451DRAFT_155668 [Mycena latifolia]
MARILSILLALCLALFTVAAPLQQRQVGDLQCNINRLKIVSSLASTTTAVGKIDTTDPTTASAVTAAQAGLTSASAGIKTIAQSLVTGQAAPASARDQVQAGLLAAQTALAGITDPTTTAAVTAAQNQLTTTIADGAGVVADCK